MELPENIGINKHAIKLVVGKHPLYSLIYVLSLVELETLKTYIKTYLRTGFIRPSKSSADVLIFFDKKLNGNLHVCVNYQGLNNPTIKNLYLLLLIGKLLDQLR